MTFFRKICGKSLENAGDSLLDSKLMMEDDLKCHESNQVELANPLKKDEIIPFENLSKCKDEEATTTTADESWYEDRSTISKVGPGIDAKPFCLTTNTGLNIGEQESRKERDRRLLLQHRETYKGPNSRNKSLRILKHRAQLDKTCEDFEEEDNTCENQCTYITEGQKKFCCK